MRFLLCLPLLILLISPLASNDDPDGPATGPEQDSSSPLSELERAQQEADDLMEMLKTTNDTLQRKLAEAVEPNRKYAEAKAEWERQEQMNTDWNDAQQASADYDAAAQQVTDADAALGRANDDLKRANGSLADAEKELARVKGEPARLDAAKTEQSTLTGLETDLKRDIKSLTDGRKTQTKTAGTAKFNVNAQLKKIKNDGCEGRETASACKNQFDLLKNFKTLLEGAEKALNKTDEDLIVKNGLLGNYTGTLEALGNEIQTLDIDVPNNVQRVADADSKVTRQKRLQEPKLDSARNAATVSSKALATLEAKKTAKEEADRKIENFPPGVVEAAQTAKFEFDSANFTKSKNDVAITLLRSQVAELSGKSEQAIAKFEALKQKSKKDEPGLGSATITAIGVVFGLLIVIGSGLAVFFVLKRRKAGAKQGNKISPSPGPAISVQSATVPATPSTASSCSSKPQEATKVDQTPHVSPVVFPDIKPPVEPAKPAKKAKESAPPKYEVPESQLVPAHQLQENLTIPSPRYIFDNYMKAPTDIRNAKKPKDIHERLEGEPTLDDKEPAAIFECGDEMKKQKYTKMEVSLRSVDEDDGGCDDTVFAEDATTKTANKSGKGAALLANVPTASVNTVFNIILSLVTAFDKRVKGEDMTKQDIMQVCVAARQEFQKEKTQLARCGAPCAVVGDVHGQLDDLIRELSLIGGVKNMYNQMLVLGTMPTIFLGDYVDRGKQQLEVIMMVFCLKIRHPEMYFVLRGNHETRETNLKHGFYKELCDRFGEEHGKDLFECFNEVFAHMPLTCLVGERVLCMHGGISEHLTSLKDIQNIPKPLHNIQDSKLATDLLWADPLGGIKGFFFNWHRGISKYFGMDALEKTLTKLDLDMIIRGHQVMKNGFGFFGMKMRLVSVFSATNVSAMVRNQAAILMLGANFVFRFYVLWKNPRPKDGHKETEEECEFRIDDNNKAYNTSFAVHKSVKMAKNAEMARAVDPLEDTTAL